ncbi:VanW family protein [Crocinitomicaceae bacterium CZZ-1]|uniref:VanW family protein n=1 Tax=Taishania pollutisoli TaxID=2766479 RepID=A0A8J6TZ22_9FLAO|nr:VanW family protein [Taishania pollutisoli]MBC9811573.1 VanW family protein [Taishania pollutisoli]
MKRLKLHVKLLRRKLQDAFGGEKFSRKQRVEIPFAFEICISQEIKSSETFENKLYNLQAASKKINEYVLFPGELFSFWRVVENPYSFKESRSINKGKIIQEVGGGICQVSGIVYYVSILAGLKVVERYNHSADLYTEETRFTPLGTDATVVYGNKDLRIKNTFDFPIKFQIDIIENRIVAKLLSMQKIEENQLQFEFLPSNESETIVEVKYTTGQLVNQSVYKKMNV